MRQFLLRVSLFVTIPLVLLTILYFISDPYKTLKPFSLDYFDPMNRDYLSSELFLMNYPEQKYDSFVFGSSRGGGINTYHWAKYLSIGAKTFLFQAWDETLTGIEQKISYIDKSGYDLKNALVLIDIPGTFAKDQAPTEALSIKDPAISGQPVWQYQMILLYDFIQKPSQWIKAIKELLNSSAPEVSFDIITNDWDKNNQYLNVSFPPQKDSLRNMSSVSRAVFLREVSNKSGSDVVTSDPLINDRFLMQLNHIKQVFDRHKTSYLILITPGYCYSSPSIASEDEEVLRRVFGDSFVFNYSGENELSCDYNNYSDPKHFGLYVGWCMIEDIYN